MKTPHKLGGQKLTLVLIILKNRLFDQLILLNFFFFFFFFFKSPLEEMIPHMQC